MQRRFTRLAAVGAVLAALATGCGGGMSQDEFEVEVRQARDRVDESLFRITQSTTPTELLRRIDQAAGEVRDAASEFPAEDAPDGFEDEATALEKALVDFAGELEATHESLNDPLYKEGLEAIEGLDFRHWDAVQRALRQLQAAGIDVAPLDRH